MLKIENITYSYPGSTHKVLDRLSMQLGSGVVCGLLGANGTGKSTLLYMIAGLLKPSCGSVTFNGVDTRLQLPGTLADIFLVPEDVELPSMEFEKYIETASVFYPKFSREMLDNYLMQFNLNAGMHLGRLSMGQKKKAFIAFALACNTSLLLMDEPTNGLDIPGKGEFRRAIVSGMSDDRTIIISTHQVRDLDRVLDHIVMIDQSGVLLNESTAAIQEKYRFVFTHQGSDINGALWIQPVAGGFNYIEPRLEGDEETDVNLESLFEFVYSQKSRV